MPAERQPASGLLSDRYALGFLGLGGTAVAGFTAGTALGPIAGLAFGGVTALLFFILWDNAGWARLASSGPTAPYDPGLIHAALQRRSGELVRQVLAEGVHDYPALGAPRAAHLGLNGRQQIGGYVDRHPLVSGFPGAGLCVVRVDDPATASPTRRPSTVDRSLPTPNGRPSTVDGSPSTVDPTTFLPSWDRLIGLGWDAVGLEVEDLIPSAESSSAARPLGHGSTPHEQAHQTPELPSFEVRSG
jgi:hypothetical protein